ncbi:UDP-glucose 4-epimerase GalE [Guptibacillus algicola]|uniref:UDP-glucose 4-epimerase GalE n=1 Tax=Guptibacillus algicola TaxID=225844 RepID=UPI001CD2B67F|nr:UDP-glucose 4-epimerase GalE [Alkalihalobacillus algicola]MCA0987027.1 UDP-glucose 4-epimerase GalE [Alkalihalobacillus algicola]
MAILVTGGAGYIGSHTCVQLISQGYKVVVVDNLSNSNIESLNRVRELTDTEIPFYKIDLLDRKSLEKVFEEHHINAVIHFAGLKAVGESVSRPLNYYYNNVAGTFVLCEVMEKYNIRKVVFSSSATVYGNPKTVPITEEEPLCATNPYGQTKLMIEQVFRTLYECDARWSVALLRYFNPIGAHISGRIGEDPTGLPNNLMPYISQVAIGKLEQLKVFGDDYETVDGTGVRDYIHVMDLANGHIKALEYLFGTTGVEAFNLGTGNGYSVLQMVKAFEEATGKKVKYSIAPRRPGDIGECYADSTKAKKELGWVAEKGIEEMCRDTWRWQLSNPNGYKLDQVHT